MHPCHVNHPRPPPADPERPWFCLPLPCKAPPVNGSEGLLIVLVVVAAGSLVVYAIVRLTNRW